MPAGRGEDWSVQFRAHFKGTTVSWSLWSVAKRAEGGVHAKSGRRRRHAEPRTGVGAPTAVPKGVGCSAVGGEETRLSRLHSAVLRRKGVRLERGKSGSSMRKNLRNRPSRPRMEFAVAGMGG